MFPRSLEAILTLLNFWTHGSKFKLASVNEIPSDFSDTNFTLLVDHFPEIPRHIQVIKEVGRFDYMQAWRIWRGSIKTEMPLATHWIPHNKLYGAFGIKGYDAFYVFRTPAGSEDQSSMKVMRMGMMQGMPWPTPDRYQREVTIDFWRGWLNEFQFEKALVIDTPNGPQVVVARFWAHPTHGRNYRYLHLFFVCLHHHELDRRARSGNFATWSQ